MTKEPITVRRAKEWRFAGKKFYDSEDFHMQAARGLRLRKPVRVESWRKHTRIREGDMIKDRWGKTGVVIEVFPEPSPEHGWCDCIAICRQDCNPQLEYKHYWKSMIETVQGVIWKR